MEGPMTMFEILIGFLILREIRRLVHSRMRSAIYLAGKDAGSTSHRITVRARPQTA
jgi:hypothetical protein